MDRNKAFANMRRIWRIYIVIYSQKRVPRFLIYSYSYYRNPNREFVANIIYFAIRLVSFLFMRRLISFLREYIFMYIDDHLQLFLRPS